MSFPLAVVAATAGNLLGSMLAYMLGASRLLDRVSFARRVMARWEDLIVRHGIRAVFAAACCRWPARLCPCPPAPAASACCRSSP
jgi:membrane protein DedA with SNARE-associated domain